MRKSEIIILVILAVSFAIAVYLYPQMPDQMASHWNTQGEVDGYMPKFWGLFLMPLVTAGLFLLFIAIPKIDPLKKNIEKFRRYYDTFVILIIAFFFYIYLLTLFWSQEYRFSMIQMMSPAFAILFYYIGILVENSKRNWFIGIRTPWTLSSDRVWDKTHKLGGKLFKITGAVVIFGIFFPDLAIYFVLIPVIFVAVYTIVYSYFEYQKLGRK